MNKAITPELSACTERTLCSSFHYYKTARPQESVTSRKSVGRKEIFSLEWQINLCCKNHIRVMTQQIRGCYWKVCWPFWRWLEALGRMHSDKFCPDPYIPELGILASCKRISGGSRGQLKTLIYEILCGSKWQQLSLIMKSFFSCPPFHSFPRSPPPHPPGSFAAHLLLDVALGNSGFQLGFLN